MVILLVFICFSINLIDMYCFFENFLRYKSSICMCYGILIFIILLSYIYRNINYIYVDFKNCLIVVIILVFVGVVSFWFYFFLCCVRL